MDNVAVVVEDRPPRGRARSPRPLRRASPQTERESYSGVLPDRITLFRGTIEREAGDDDEELRRVDRRDGRARGRAPLRDLGRAALESSGWRLTSERRRRAGDAARAGRGPDVPRARRRADRRRRGAGTARSSPRPGNARERRAGSDRARGDPRAPRGRARRSGRGASRAARCTVTLEPCAMCAGAARARAARPGRVRRRRSEGRVRRLAREPRAGSAAEPRASS